MGGLTFCSSRIYKDGFLCVVIMFSQTYLLNDLKKKDIIALFETRVSMS